MVDLHLDRPVGLLVCWPTSMVVLDRVTRLVGLSVDLDRSVGLNLVWFVGRPRSLVCFYVSLSIRRRSAARFVGRSTGLLLGLSVGRSGGRSSGLLIDQPAKESPGLYVRHSVGMSVTEWSMTRGSVGSVR